MPKTTRYKLTIAYDGSRYSGWQVQPSRVTVQGQLEHALREMTGEKPKLHGSGRTDQGVHARAQVAHVDIRKPLAVATLVRGLNALAPPDIRVLRAEQTSASFHARRSAIGKQYRYYVWNAAVLPPFLRFYRTHVVERLDVAAMNEAARHLRGRHDFAAFTANPNRVVESTVRTLSELTVKRRGSEVLILASSEGFLYKMVRSLAGLLIRVGVGRVEPAAAREIRRSKRRTARVPTAPPQGLFLWRVLYAKRGA